MNEEKTHGHTNIYKYKNNKKDQNKMVEYHVHNNDMAKPFAVLISIKFANSAIQ